MDKIPDSNPLPVYSVVLCAFNEEEALPFVLKDFDGTIDPKTANLVEFVLVNDGSGDSTGTIMEEWKKECRFRVTVLHHLTQSGLGKSIISGIAQACGEYVLTTDGDGQYQAKDVKKIIETVEQSGRTFDYVVGGRTKEFRQVWTRIPGKKILSVIANHITQGKVADFNSGLRTIRRRWYLEWLHLLPSKFGTSTATTILSVKTGLSGVEIPIEMLERRGGKSCVKQLRDGFLTIRTMLGMAKMAEKINAASRKNSEN